MNVRKQNNIAQGEKKKMIIYHDNEEDFSKAKVSGSVDWAHT